MAARFRPILRACWEASNSFDGYLRAAPSSASASKTSSRERK